MGTFGGRMLGRSYHSEISADDIEVVRGWISEGFAVAVASSPMPRDDAGREGPLFRDRRSRRGGAVLYCWARIIAPRIIRSSSTTSVRLTGAKLGRPWYVCLLGQGLADRSDRAED